MEKRLDEEVVGECWVCGKVHRRMDAADWYFLNGTLVCRSHEGAHAWYSGAISMATEKLELRMANREKE